MKYKSTRGAESGLSFENVLLSGYSKDHGLYMPEKIPTIDEEEFFIWSNLTYPQLVYEIIRKYISSREIEDEDLRSTSGDTGSAAIESSRGLNSVDIMVLYPFGRVSRIQELQMTTIKDSNVHVIAADGTSDDIDKYIKQCFADEVFSSKNNLISVNSINWARIMAQIPIYFYTYYRSNADCKKRDILEVIVPTGAAGNITAGCVAYKMGLPVQLVAAVNENDIVSRTVRNGNFSIADLVIPTYSCAMDIQIPYNLERLLLLFTNYNTVMVKELFEDFERKGSVQIPKNIIMELQKVVKDSHVASDTNVIEVIKKILNEYNYLICPHTAVGIFYHIKVNSEYKRVVMATASPAKFPEAVTAAGGTPTTKGIEHLSGKSPENIYVLKKEDDWLKFIQQKIKDITIKK